MNALNQLNELINSNEWLSIPDEITSREGVQIDTSEETWILPLPRKHAKIHFEKVKSDWLKWSFKVFIMHQIQTVSSDAGIQNWAVLSSDVLSKENKFNLSKATNRDEFKDSLITLMEKTIVNAKRKKRLWSLYRTIQWYIWCAENYNELGFCPIYGSELDGMIIPGNPKGEAVRMEDPDKGPLHQSLELPLLIKALKEDKCKSLKCLQEKAAMVLSIAFGRNSSNLTFLKESDLENLSGDANAPCFIIKMPRIKKRQIDPRADLLDEYLEDEFAKTIEDLIEANKKIDNYIEVDGKLVEIERPIFFSHRINNEALENKQYEYCFNMKSVQITGLLVSFVKRHNIISPITTKPLHISTRRLRYTLATGLAAEGISKRELARILDHSDTQHVQVYYELAGAIIKHLDKALAKGFSEYLDFFKGNVINSVEDAINGERDDKHLSFVNNDNPKDQSDIGVCGESNICHLDPPYSCYLCPKFQPYRDANHEHVLDCLLSDREKRIQKYESARLGIQLDEVISAVAQVAKICEKEASHA